jgi:hypothetical protein
VVFAGGLLALVLFIVSTAGGAQTVLGSDDDEQQLRDAAQQCSETVLRRYALSSADSAEKVAQAAFYKCSELWARFADIAGRRVDADPDVQKSHKWCLEYPNSPRCPPLRLPSSSYVMDAAHDMFTYKAATEVFDIRAEAAGK